MGRQPYVSNDENDHNNIIPNKLQLSTSFKSLSLRLAHFRVLALQEPDKLVLLVC